MSAATVGENGENQVKVIEQKTKSNEGGNESKKH